MPGNMRRAVTPGSLYRLIYRSRDMIARAVPDAVTEQGLQRELRAIVCGARGRNRAESVTGALLFSNGGFEQVLEGPREVVERRFERIVADRRHTDVTVLSFTPTQRRSFPDWPMAFCDQSALGHLSDRGVLAAPRVTTGSDVLRLLERVVQQEDVWMGV
jgi:hypothetical protein